MSGVSFKRPKGVNLRRNQLKRGNWCCRVAVPSLDVGGRDKPWCCFSAKEPEKCASAEWPRLIGSGTAPTGLTEHLLVPRVNPAQSLRPPGRLAPPILAVLD